MKALTDEVKLKVLEGNLEFNDIKDNLVLLFEDERCHSSEVNKPTYEWCGKKLGFCVDIEGNGRSICTICNPDVFERENLTVGDVMKICFKNMAEDTLCTPLECAVLGGIDDLSEEWKFSSIMPTLVVRKHLSEYGVSFIVNPFVCDTAYDSIGAFYIIFSSKHDVLLLPEKMFIENGEDLDEDKIVSNLISMVSEVNGDHKVMRESDVFGDIVYKYVGDNKFRSFLTGRSA